MNRERRRAMKKILRSRGLNGHGNDLSNVICDGDSVVLNTKQIMARKDYQRMQLEYREFVERNQGKVFIAHPRHVRPDGFSAVIALDGVEPWNFWYGDLIKLESNGREAKNHA